jgi:hypothetical protein
MQGGYPQQGRAYPQQGMQGGYPQQGMGYPQQGMQGGYPQQGMGYPQQGMQQGAPVQGGVYGANATGGGFPQAAPMPSMMKMPGVGQTSVQVSETPTSTTVSQNIKSVGVDDIPRFSSKPAEPDDDDDDEDDGTMSREDMLKAAKQKKKNAKLNANFKKKMRDSGF